MAQIDWKHPPPKQNMNLYTRHRRSCHPKLDNPTLAAHVFDLLEQIQPGKLYNCHILRVFGKCLTLPDNALVPTKKTTPKKPCKVSNCGDLRRVSRVNITMETPVAVFRCTLKSWTW